MESERGPAGAGAREPDDIAERDPAVGGRIDRDANDADLPLRQAGGGEAEGFEQAEEELIEAASHGDPAADPLDQRFPGEVESDRSGAAYAEPDEEDVTEKTSDPDSEAGPDDPGAGPGIAAER